PPSDLGPVVPAPPDGGGPPPPAPPTPLHGTPPAVPLSPDDLEPPAPDEAAPAAPRVTLPPMPAGPRVPWSAASDPDLPALPAGVGVADARPWTAIVVHHSATRRGSVALFDTQHRAKGWGGVGYAFVIGNGTDTGDGEIEVTFRWREQRDGVHAKGWDDVSIGICLVGNYEETPPTPAQREALVRLVRHLRRRFSIPAERVVAHQKLNPTACPGRLFPMQDVVAASAP
ncbi:MAG: N-acetylmuramoyl-L-alanine amidase, partial [Planctomycetia bacterium]|nr:N-acetylmuramoyl-L-alanine amidase [Planctomycetia bacterium]